MNELLFIFHSLFITGCVLGALYVGKEALIGLIALLAIFSNLFVTKQITLFGLHATPTDAFTIGIVLSLNVLREYYGQAITKKAISISFALSLFYTVVSQLHVLYVPNLYDAMHHHAVALFGIMPRIITASLFTYFVVQRFDCFFYEFLKKRCKNNYLIIRNYGSLIISQFLDTALFSFLGLYGVVDSIIPVVGVSYCIKLLVIFIATPFLWFSKKIMDVKKYEHLSI